MKTRALIIAALTAICVLSGCGQQQKQYGDNAADWKKTAPPPSWRGPGQPGGPPTGALAGPGAPPPGPAAKH